MIRLLILLACLSGPLLLFPQTRYRTEQGSIRFNASTPLEDIDAGNKKVNAILNPETGAFASVLLIRDFHFRRKLMEEHFNENYMESDTYPKAYFTGELQGFATGAFSSAVAVLPISGELTIHGVTKKLVTEARVSRSGDTIRLTVSFVVRPESFGVEVPKLLFHKIAREVRVDVDLELGETPAAGD